MCTTYRSSRTLQEVLSECDPFTRRRLDGLTMAEVVEIECEMVGVPPQTLVDMKYTTSKSYGAARRIWMLRDTWTSCFSVGKQLAHLSIWGGHDKDLDGLVSWEFHPDRFEEACSYLAGYGFGWVSSTEAL